MCYIEPFYIGFTSEQNKTVEHAVAKSYDDIHDIFTVPCEKSKMVSFASSVAPASRSTISFKIFWDFSMFTKFSFHYKWTEVRLLLINMVYTNCLTSYWTT